MFKRFAAIAATLLTAGLIVGVPTQADAYVDRVTANHCKNHGVTTATGGYTVTLCTAVRYHKQDDGNGVVVDGVWIDVNNGCGDLENPEVKDQLIWLTPTTSSSPVYDTSPLRDGDCHFFASPQNGWMQENIAAPNQNNVRYHWTGQVNLGGCCFIDNWNAEFNWNIGV